MVIVSIYTIQIPILVFYPVKVGISRYSGKDFPSVHFKSLSCFHWLFLPVLHRDLKVIMTRAVSQELMKNSAAFVTKYKRKNTSIPIAQPKEQIDKLEFSICPV